MSFYLYFLLHREKYISALLLGKVNFKYAVFASFILYHNSHFQSKSGIWPYPEASQEAVSLISDFYLEVLPSSPTVLFKKLFEKNMINFLKIVVVFSNLIHTKHFEKF